MVEGHRTDCWQLAEHLRVDFMPGGVAELAFGPAGGMPMADGTGHAALGTVWAQLAAAPRDRLLGDDLHES